MTSISDVAKKAGVVVSTVSKVFNNYGSISEETRQRVLEAAKELNYVPNAIASALSSKQGRRVAIVVFINNQRQSIDEINMQYIFGALGIAKTLKIELVTVFSTDLEGKDDAELLQHFRSLRVQALVIYGLHKEEQAFQTLIAAQHFPAVIVDAPLEFERVSYVMVDHTKAQYDITAFMAERHKNVERVLYLAGRRDGFVTDLRLQGVVDACADLELSLNAQYADFSERKAYDLTLEYADDADLVICASDLMAIGAVNALKYHDIYRPVCGFDGITLLGYTNYRIFTVRQDFYEISQEAIRAVDALLAGGKGEARLLDYEITRINYEDVIQ